MKLSHHIHGQTLFLAILGLPLLATVLAAPVAVPYDAAISGTDSELSPREALYQVAERSAAAVVHDVQHEDSDLVKRGSDDYEKIAHDMHPRSTGGLYLIQESSKSLFNHPSTRALHAAHAHHIPLPYSRTPTTLTNSTKQNLTTPKPADSSESSSANSKPKQKPTP